ncbi:MAG: ATP-binding cassette domain-containing protein [Brasilonema octagenarum HA4186-MV1]|jgi:subfamily B ATP-binding cassette protein MsbA|uniref:ABC transporter ATP-binding protein n=1 Tax=Brasilonema sennae CENA114 TaxID=415709 RepID=A0A856MBH1_9CYAN|nr:heterocyst formation ABC transporter subunit HepA [Brasilonema sennae]MBW4627515.1 ATP-binding cassette domain-containing protein [Brasilonema octagenarum HA4186-MV1]QDL08042.1 ABC transporter ATP-binding protein [Brasilonema sennae CENA114]QDL14401.1 ABC transporter ATP-binding protein [Brasilonema octagenarum UFV-E1]
MHVKLSKPVQNILKNLVKTTKFWQENYLILREFKHFPKIAAIALLFSFIAAIFEGLNVTLLAAFLQNLTTPNVPFQTKFELLNTLLGADDPLPLNRLYRVSFLLFVSAWIRSGLNYLAQFYTEITQLTLVDRLRKQIFEKLQSVKIGYFNNTKSGELINTITTELEKLKQAFGDAAFLFSRTLNAVVYLTSMFWISWQLSIISLMLFSLLAVGLSTLNSRVREASFDVTKANNNFTSIAIEFINGIRTVHAFSTEDFERKRYYNASLKLVNHSKKIASVWMIVKPLAEALATTILVAMIVLAFTVFVTKGLLQTAFLLTFFFVLFRLVPIIQDINGVATHISTMYGSSEVVKKLLEIDELQYFHNGHIEFSGLKRSIEFVSVDFGYDSESLVLSNIRLMIERGRMTALVGASGAGKTTLADLIPRFYDPTRGHVFIDGVDLRDIEIKSLRRKIAVVSQDTFIFNTSVLNNIAYGSEGATDEEIYKAAQLANALEFIQEMPEGFNTQLGDRGVRLSGGQRQRIAIARALLRNPEILILDEATSALDTVSEKLIQESIEKLSVGRTVIVIAHRLSTIVRADKVVVLEQGQIVEQGGYQELLDIKGKLWKYHQMQHQLN